MSKSPFRNILSGYETEVYPTESGGEIHTGVKFAEYTLSGNMTKRKKKLVSLGIVRFLQHLVRMISYTSTRGYGALFLCYGLLTVTSELAKEYFGVAGTDVVFPSVLGAIFALLAIPLLVVDKPFCIALQDFELTDYLFFEFFSIKRMHRQTSTRAIPPLVMAVFGIAFAALGMFFGARQVFAVSLAAVAIYISFVAPEFAFFSTIVMLPAFPLLSNGIVILACMIMAAFISFMRKVIFGKRVYSIEQYDVLVMLFTFCILISGIFMQGLDSFESSLSLIIFAMGYPLASNLIANRRLAESALGAIIISSLLTAVQTVCEISSLLIGGGIAALADYSARATFETSGAFAAFLLASAFSVGYFAVTDKRRSMRIICGVLFIIEVLMLVTTGRFDAIAALVIGMLIYAILRHAKKLSAFAFLLLPMPLLILLLPDGAFSFMPFAFGSGITVAERMELWGASIEMLGNNIFLGVGIGSESFGSVIVNYGNAAQNSANLLLEIACEAGIFALVVFLLLFAVRFVHFIVYREYIWESRVTHLSQSALVMLFTLIAFGMTEYFWLDTEVYYLFWCIFGIGSAAFRIAKREHDDRVMYYGDLMSVDSSVMDVRIK